MKTNTKFAMLKTTTDKNNLRCILSKSVSNAKSMLEGTILVLNISHMVSALLNRSIESYMLNQSLKLRKPGKQPKLRQRHMRS
jgi:hypothetical protein